MSADARVMTVLGPIGADELGITLAHEHLFLDLTNQFQEPSDPQKRLIGQSKVSRQQADLLWRDPYAIKDNLLLDDLSLALEEIDGFKRAGGKTVVECTSVGIHRDARNLHRFAQLAGMNVIAGCGYYTRDTHPEQMSSWSPEMIAKEIIRDLTVGMDGTDIRAGVIGEIGTSHPIHPEERKNLIAAALAHRQTGIGIQVHTYPWGKTGTEVVDILLGQEVTPSKIVICHTDVDIHLDYMQSLLDRGVMVQFDNFGKEFAIPEEDRGFAGGVFAADSERVKTIGALARLGYERQILITNDICFKCMLHRFGGKGYDHILRNVSRMLLEEGISQEILDLFMIENPRLFLTPDLQRE